MAKKTRMMKKKGMRKTKRRMRGGDPPKTPSKPSNAERARRMANNLLGEFDNINNTSSRSPSSVGSRSPSSVGSRSVTSSSPLNNNPPRKFRTSNKVAPPPEEKFLATGPCYSSQTCKYGLQCVTTNSYGRRHERVPGSIGKPGRCEYL